MLIENLRDLLLLTAGVPDSAVVVVQRTATPGCYDTQHARLQVGLIYDPDQLRYRDATVPEMLAGKCVMGLVLDVGPT